MALCPHPQCHFYWYLLILRAEPDFPYFLIKSPYAENVFNEDFSTD